MSCPCRGWWLLSRQESPSPTWASQTSFQQQTSLITPHTQRPETQEHATRSLQDTMRIGETGRSFNTRIKEHKACQWLGDGDKSAIVKHAQQHKINWEDSSLITSIPHWHTRRVRGAIEILQHNTVPQDSGLHFNDIWHPLLQKTQRLLHPGPQPAQHQVASFTSATNTQVIHTPVIQSFSWGRSAQTDRNIETPSQPQQFFSELPHGATASFTSSTSTYFNNSVARKGNKW